MADRKATAKQYGVVEHSSEAVVRLLTGATVTTRNIVCIHNPHATEWNASSHSYNCKSLVEAEGQAIVHTSAEVWTKRTDRARWLKR
jgi:hypothetical protein